MQKTINGFTIPEENFYSILVFVCDDVMLGDPYGEENDKLARKRFRTLFTAHELGHARGKDFNDLTDDETHNTGHNGEHNYGCIMSDANRLPYMNGLNDYEALKLEQMSSMAFCQGHQHLLFSIYWASHVEQVS